MCKDFWVFKSRFELPEMVLGLPWEVLAVSPWQALGGRSPILSRERVSSCLCSPSLLPKCLWRGGPGSLGPTWKALKPLYLLSMDGQPLSGPYMDSFIASLCCCSTFPFSSQTLSSANTDSFNFLFSLSKVPSKFVWNRDLEMREARSSQKIYWSGKQIEQEKKSVSIKTHLWKE